MTTRHGCDTQFRTALLAVFLLAGGARAEHTLVLGPDTTLGLWSVWETGVNEYLLTVSLQPDGGPGTPLRLYNVEFSWDAGRLQPVGGPGAGDLFAGQPDSWFGHFDVGATRTVTQTLLGETAGVTPTGSVLLFSQLFHAIDPAGGSGLIQLDGATLRGPNNEMVPVLATDEVNLSLDVQAPQGYTFDIQALNPAGNQAWSAQPLVASALVPGDGSLAGWILSESATLPANPSPAWTAPPAPTSWTLSAGDGLKTVRAFLRDSYGNRTTLSDAISLDTQAPLYHVTQLQARPRHQGCLVTWNNPVAPDFHAVRLYRRGWSDDGLSRYPEYDDIDPMSTYPETEAAALAAGFVLVYQGDGQSWLDPVTPRDVQRYVAFCVDLAGNVGPGDATARDRSTNYLLGDTRTPWDGTVHVQDLVRLAGAYSTLAGDPAYDPQLDFGPTDDNSREGIPLTDNRVGFEDLMIFAMNYGPFGPALGCRRGDPGAARTDSPTRLLLEPREGGLALRLEPAGEWLGLHLVLCWEGGSVLVPRDVAGEAVIRQSTPGRLLLDRVLLPGEDGAARLATLDFSAGIPAGLRVAEFELRDGANQPLAIQNDAGPERPAALVFQGACPNPFNPETLLRFTLPETAEVSVTVYNTLGQTVRRLEAGRLEPGAHALRLSGDGLASGVYLLELQAGAATRLERALLVR
ncbi:MAG: T9SS type A sorting domain-containing protein [Candidatus Delongbacteria bacterium]